MDLGEDALNFIMLFGVTLFGVIAGGIVPALFGGVLGILASLAKARRRNLEIFGARIVFLAPRWSRSASLLGPTPGRKGATGFRRQAPQRGSSDSADVFRFRRKMGEEPERLVESCLQLGSLFMAEYELHGGGLGPPPRTKAFIDFRLWRERRSCGRWSWKPHRFEPEEFPQSPSLGASALRGKFRGYRHPRFLSDPRN